MPPTRCWSPAPRLGAAPARPDRARRALRGPRSRPAGVRRASAPRSSPPPRSTRRASPHLPSGRWRWRAWCRRTRSAGLPTMARAADAGTARSRRSRRSRMPRPWSPAPRPPRRRRWRCRASPTPRARRPASAAPRWCSSPRPGSPAAIARTSHSVSATALAGQGTGMQRDYDYQSTVHLADLEDPAAIGRSAGERAHRPAQSRAARRPRSCRWSTTRASPAACSAIWPARSTAPRSRAAPPSCKDKLGSRIFARGHHGPRRSAPRARPALRARSTARACRPRRAP